MDGNNSTPSMTKSFKGPIDIDLAASGISIPLWQIVVINTNISPHVSNVKVEYDNEEDSINISWTPPDHSMYTRTHVVHYHVNTHTVVDGAPRDNGSIVTGTATSLKIKVTNYDDIKYISIIVSYNLLIPHVTKFYEVPPPTSEQLAKRAARMRGKAVAEAVEAAARAAVVAQEAAAAERQAAAHKAAILAAKKLDRRGYDQCIKDGEQCYKEYNNYIVNGVNLYDKCMDGGLGSRSGGTGALCNPPHGCRWCL